MQSQRDQFEIETESLILRPYRPEDVAEIAPILGDKETMRFWPRPLTFAEAEAWVERSLASYLEIGFGRYPVREKSTGRIVGDCGILTIDVQGRLVHDLGFIFRHDFWGRGYATEAATAVRDAAFCVFSLSRLNAIVPCDHVASRRVAEKIGMRKVSEFDNQRNRGIRTYFYNLTLQTWEALVGGGATPMADGH